MCDPTCLGFIDEGRPYYSALFYWCAYADVLIIQLSALCHWNLSYCQSDFDHVAVSGQTYVCSVSDGVSHSNVSLLSAVWRLIRGWLSEAQKKIIFQVNKNSIQEYITSDQLEDHMVKK